MTLHIQPPGTRSLVRTFGATGPGEAGPRTATGGVFRGYLFMLPDRAERDCGSAGGRSARE